MDKFGAREINHNQAKRIDEIRMAFEDLWFVIQKNAPIGDELRLCDERLQEACMWATKAISREVPIIFSAKELLAAMEDGKKEIQNEQ